jgi:large subunit ribosomal protein L21
MFAVVDILGQQFKVTEKKKYYVPRLTDTADSEITLDKVLLYSDENGSTKFGSPFVEGLTVTAKVLGHLKDEKVIVFKKKRRTGYQKSNGHRQHLSHIEILKIG